MQAVRSPAPTAQVMFVAESFCPTFNGTIELSKRG
jgi:hypothetical protein